MEPFAIPHSPACYISDRQMREDVGVLFFADHVRAIIESFDLKLADAGNPLVRQLGRYLRWPRSDPSDLTRQPRWRRLERLSRRPIKRPSCRVLESCPASTFRLPSLTFFRDFSTVLRLVPGYNAKTWHGPHSPTGTAASPKCLPPVVTFDSDYVTLGSNPRKYDPTRVKSITRDPYHAQSWLNRDGNSLA
jgi:hypothetical protein